MPTLAIIFPTIDPVLVEIGPISIRWYALAYVAGLVMGWQYIHFLARKNLLPLSKRQVDDLLVISTLSIVIGGRLGYTIFYQPSYYFSNPLEILMIWSGGMSFHGGLIGMIIGLIIFTLKLRIPLLRITDGVSMAVPIGLFFGRIANFINGELYGRPSDVAWAIKFPTGGNLTRHPSQIYEALLEGLLLFIILAFLAFSTRAWHRPGFLTGTFLVGYSIARVFVEFFREPDAELGFLFFEITMGQTLSIPMLLLGVMLLFRAYYKGKFTKNGNT